MNHDPLEQWINHRRNSVGQDPVDGFTDNVMAAIRSQHQPEPKSHDTSDEPTQRSPNPLLSAACIIVGGVKVWIALELAI